MNKSDCVRVYFEIGHEASLRNKRTPEGFTHDWQVYVRGVDNAEIHHFVEKVVFNLHDTFPKPKRTIKEPPYCLKESGYAGFNLPIDIYFKNQKAEKRKQRFFYDLTLPENGPRLNKLTKEKADFPNPPEDFRRKLIRGGGVGVGNDTTMSSAEKTNSITPNSHGDDSKSSPHSGKPKLSNSNSDIPKKHKPKETSKSEESRGSSFAALFGTPIKTIKHSPTSKPAVKPSSSSELKSSHEKPAKESSKISKHSPHKDKDKDKENSLSKYKDKDRDKDKDNEKTNKEKDKSKDKEHKEKDKSKDKILKKSNSPIPPKDIRKEENPKRSSEENKDRSSSKNDTVREKKHKEKKHKEDREKKEVHKEHEKKEIEKEKVNDKIEKKPENPKEKEVIKENKFKLSEKEEKKIKPIEREKDRTHISEKQKHKHKRKEKHRKEDDKHRHKKKPKEKTPEPIPPPKAKSPTPPPPPPPPPVPTKPAINPLNMLIQELSDKDSDSDFSVSMEEDVKSDPPSEPPPKPPKIEEKKIVEVREEKEKVKKKEKKSKDEDKDKEGKKRKRKTKDKDEPIEKIIKTEVKEEPVEKSPKREERSESPETQFTDDYVTQLRDLQQKIMTLQDNADLQRVVQVISETGQFEITQRTFDFDLCALDRSTVKRLQDMFITAS